MNTKLRHLLAKLKTDERGLSTVEYVVLLVLIVAVAVALWNTFGTNVATKLSDAGTAFNTKVVTTHDGTKADIGESADVDYGAGLGTGP